MQAIVVYESHWGNTAAVAQAIARGIGPEAEVVPVAQATPERLARADLLVAGAPVWAFGLPRQGQLEDLRGRPSGGPERPDLTGPSLRTWLESLPRGQAHGLGAAFETAVRWSPGGATGTIARNLDEAGYRRLDKGARFVVRGTTGPLRDGELEKARAWGATLRRLVGGDPSTGIAA